MLILSSYISKRPTQCEPIKYLIYRMCGYWIDIIRFLFMPICAEVDKTIIIVIEYDMNAHLIFFLTGFGSFVNKKLNHLFVRRYVNVNDWTCLCIVNNATWSAANEIDSFGHITWFKCSELHSSKYFVHIRLKWPICSISLYYIQLNMMSHCKRNSENIRNIFHYLFWTIKIFPNYFINKQQRLNMYIGRIKVDEECFPIRMLLAVGRRGMKWNHSISNSWHCKRQCVLFMEH